MKIDWDFVGGFLCCLVVLTMAWAFICVFH